MAVAVAIPVAAAAVAEEAAAADIVVAATAEAEAEEVAVPHADNAFVTKNDVKIAHVIFFAPNLGVSSFFIPFHP